MAAQAKDGSKSFVDLRKSQGDAELVEYMSQKGDDWGEIMKYDHEKFEEEKKLEREKILKKK